MLPNRQDLLQRNMDRMILGSALGCAAPQTVRDSVPSYGSLPMNSRRDGLKECFAPNHSKLRQCIYMKPSTGAKTLARAALFSGYISSPPIGMCSDMKRRSAELRRMFRCGRLLPIESRPWCLHTSVQAPSPRVPLRSHTRVLAHQCASTRTREVLAGHPYASARTPPRSAGAGSLLGAAKLRDLRIH